MLKYHLFLELIYLINELLYTFKRILTSIIII